VRSPPHPLLIGIVALLAGGWTNADGEEAKRLRETITALSTNGSRLAGYPGDRFAADLVERELIAAGVEGVTREPYEVVVPMDHGASLQILRDETVGTRADEPPIELKSLWPNLVRTNTLGPQGLEGELIYAGRGKYADFNGARVRGSIALMEFNSGKNWKNAAALGVAAVIFIEPEETSRIEAMRKWSWVPVDVPRFWMDRASATALRRRVEGDIGGLRVRRQARMD